MPRHDAWNDFDATLIALTELPSPVDDLDFYVAVEDLTAAVLAVRDQELMALDGHGHTHAEIAAKLGISRQAVSARVQRAQRRRQHPRKATG
jgi:DNA-directed RNA polymerase specialized sigma24 family protein